MIFGSCKLRMKETNETELIFSARQHSICLARYAIVSK